jgi:membrane protease subunit (stomatin/prohibitin family)
MLLCRPLGSDSRGAAETLAGMNARGRGSARVTRAAARAQREQQEQQQQGAQEEEEHAPEQEVPEGEQQPPQQEAEQEGIVNEEEEEEPMGVAQGEPQAQAPAQGQALIGGSAPSLQIGFPNIDLDVD